MTCLIPRTYSPLFIQQGILGCPILPVTTGFPASSTRLGVTAVVNSVSTSTKPTQRYQDAVDFKTGATTRTAAVTATAATTHTILDAFVGNVLLLSHFLYVFLSAFPVFDQRIRR
ncbi:hypothetical protein P5673_012880 [Acropora cervicornis]|uniref:Uncharacterized protein n=1 Tax=Acropora cervicornis TaxID=6130 RepID=A0AAD9QM73_ACRCE|nr:hypothetical protein P5673_012880 [Acropora cervicornis]